MENYFIHYLKLYSFSLKPFKLRNYSYMELLNEIVSKRVEQEIPKEHVKQFLLPEFYDVEQSDSNEVYINSIFSYIFLSMKSSKSVR